jgi:hypothetical protein
VSEKAMGRASDQIGKVAQWRIPFAATAQDVLACLITPNAYLRSSSETFSWKPPAADLERWRVSAICSDLARGCRTSPVLPLAVCA